MKTKNAPGKIGGYHLIEQIYASNSSVIWKGENPHLQPVKVILKLLKTEYPTPEQLSRFQREYQITRKFNDQGIIQVYHLEKYQNRLVMILEDFGGIALNYIIKQRLLTIREFLTIAIKITKALAVVHHYQIIHKDLNPSNIVINEQTGDVKLIDFGISTELNQEKQAIKNPRILEGTLPYMSPEQTGRMNRYLDYRSDFYSLGITFYQLLTNRLPFQAKDTLSWLYCHLAEKPQSPEVINSHIPEMLSRIVMKLIAKNAEDRYQSAWGLLADLENCFQQWDQNQQIIPFSLAQKDIITQFNLPQKLYGREQEINQLLQSFENLEKTKIKLLLVTGHSGVGKTALINEIHKPITAKKGIFISGKYEQYQTNIPYFAIIQAFDQFCNYLLTETREDLSKWQNKILTAIGKNGQLLIDVIPKLEQIIGFQPPLPQVGIKEQENRFNLVVQNFITAISNPNHPLILFLDDLQWADSSSLKLLIKLLNNQNIVSLFIIVSYRNNPVYLTNNLQYFLQNATKLQGKKITKITLDNLTINDVHHLINDTLNQSPQETQSLADLVYHKTQGNSFFIREFLKSLFVEKLLFFNQEQYQWQWDIQAIENRSFTDNVVELIADKLENLPHKTKSVIKKASCLGNRFQLSDLALISNLSPQKTIQYLWKAINQEVIFTLDYNYKMVQEEELQKAQLKFGHDRIQQAAYSLISETEKLQIHGQIAQLMLGYLSPEERQEKITEIVNHLNLGWQGINHPLDRHELAYFNLLAGKKAKSASAYQAAFIYLQTGINYLSADSWTSLSKVQLFLIEDTVNKTGYQIILELYNQIVETAYMCGDFEQMNDYINTVLNFAKNTLDKLRVYEVKIQAYTSHTELAKAIQIGLELVKKLGEELPENPDFHQINQGLQSLNHRLSQINIRELINLPTMNKPEKLAIMTIFNHIIVPTSISNPQLFSLMVIKQVNLCLDWGNSPLSAMGYVTYGTLLCFPNICHVNLGYEFGQLALQIVEKFQAKNLQARVLQIVAVMTLHWHKHLKETIAMCQDAYKIGLETGDLEFTVLSALQYAIALFLSGKQLDKVQEKIEFYSTAIQQFHNQTFFYELDLFKTLIFYLQSEDYSSNWAKLVPKLQTYYQVLFQANNMAGISYVHIAQSQLAYLFGDYQSAFKYITLCEQYASGLIALPMVAVFYFYNSLIRLVNHHNLTEIEQQQNWKIILENQRKMKIWADNCPSNYLHKFYLVEAEKERVSGNLFTAIDYYEEAIDLAEKNEYMQEQALALELAAECYLQQGKERIARVYLKESHYLYQIWGAIAKVKFLEKKYNQFLHNYPQKNQGIKSEEDTIITTTQEQKSLDIDATIKASLAISSQLHLDKLLLTLMEILLENTGAEKIILLLEKAGNFYIEAEAMNNHHTQVLQSLPVTDQLPLSVINYVIHSQQSVIESEAINSSQFNHDPYIENHQIISLLCTPLIYQGQAIGVIYLENNVIKDAFTAKSIQVIQLLSGQAAIAITNAQLYTQIEENENRLKQFLEGMPIAVAVLDAQGHPYFANQKAVEIMGKGVLPHVEADEIPEVYQVYFTDKDEIYPPEKLPIIRALQGEKSNADDVAIRNKDKIIPVESWGTPIYDQLGNIVYGLVAFHDITERIQHEKILKNYNQTLEQQVAERTAELAKANAELQLLAALDGLTKIANRRRFDEYLQQEWLRCLRDKIPLALILFDVDYFKRYNDHYGHQKGDECLQKIAQAIKNTAKRASDLAARYGGE
jgi:PAS domain S-box-containing protein